MINLGTIFAILSLRDEMTPALQSASAGLKQTGANMTASGVALTAALTVPLALVGGTAVKSFADFDAAMNQSIAIMGDVSDMQRGEMSAAAREVAKTTSFSAKQAAESYFFLASAGLDAAQSIGALPQVASFAQAGMFDMATATDLLTDAQSAMGLTFEDTQENMLGMARVSDVLVKANTLANATVEQFSTALTTEAGPAMKAFGVTLEDGVAVLGAYADQGIKGATAGSSFARMLRLMVPAVRDNREEFDRLGITVVDANDQLLPMADIIGSMSEALDGMGVTAKSGQLELLGFQKRMQGVILPLLGAQEKIRDYREELERAGGVTQEVADKQLRTFWERLGLLKDRLLDAAITVGSEVVPIIESLEPVLIGAIDAVGLLAKAFAALPVPMQAATLAVVAFVAALGPLLIASGLVVSGFGSLLPVIATVAGPAGMAAITSSAGKLTMGLRVLAGKVLPDFMTVMVQGRAATGQFAGGVRVASLAGTGLRAALTGPLGITIALAAVALSFKEVRDVITPFIDLLGALGRAIGKLARDDIGDWEKALDHSLATWKRWLVFVAGTDKFELTDAAKELIRDVKDVTQALNDFADGTTPLERAVANANAALDELDGTTDQVGWRFKLLNGDLKKVVTGFVGPTISAGELAEQNRQAAISAAELAAAQEHLRAVMEGFTTVADAAQMVANLALAVKQGTVPARQLEAAYRALEQQFIDLGIVDAQVLADLRALKTELKIADDAWRGATATVGEMTEEQIRLKAAMDATIQSHKDAEQAVKDYNTAYDDAITALKRSQDPWVAAAENTARFILENEGAQQALDHLIAQGYTPAAAAAAILSQKLQALKDDAAAAAAAARELGDEAGRTGGILGGLKSVLGGIVGSIKDIWKGMTGGKGLAGLFENLGKGIIDGFGQLLSGGLTSLANKAVSAITGWISGIFKKANVADHVREFLGRDLSQGLVDAMEAARAQTGGDISAAFRLLIADAIKESTISSLTDLQSWVTQVHQVLSSVDEGTLTQAQAIQSMGAAWLALIPSMSEVGGSAMQLQSQFSDLISRFGATPAVVAQITAAVQLMASEGVAGVGELVNWLETLGVTIDGVKGQAELTADAFADWQDAKGTLDDLRQQLNLLKNTSTQMTKGFVVSQAEMGKTAEEAHQIWKQASGTFITLAIQAGLSAKDAKAAWLSMSVELQGAFVDLSDTSEAEFLAMAQAAGLTAEQAAAAWLANLDAIAAETARVNGLMRQWMNDIGADTSTSFKEISDNWHAMGARMGLDQNTINALIKADWKEITQAARTSFEAQADAAKLTGQARKDFLDASMKNFREQTRLQAREAREAARQETRDKKKALREQIQAQRQMVRDMRKIFRELGGIIKDAFGEIGDAAEDAATVSVVAAGDASDAWIEAKNNAQDAWDDFNAGGGVSTSGPIPPFVPSIPGTQPQGVPTVPGAAGVFQPPIVSGQTSGAAPFATTSNTATDNSDAVVDRLDRMERVLLTVLPDAIERASRHGSNTGAK